MSREENLEYVLGFYSPDPSAWERPDELPRWAAVEYDDHKQSWIAFCETQEEALDYFYTDEGGWQPVAVVDLETGQAYSVEVTCKLGKETTL